MTDVFQALRQCPSVERVANLPRETDEKIWDCIFFLCPQTKDGIRLNRSATALTTRYRTSQSVGEATESRVGRALGFQAEAAAAGVSCTLTAVFAAADAFLLFPFALDPPGPPSLPIKTLSNWEAVQGSRERFYGLYEEQPWLKVPGGFHQQEDCRLRQLLPTQTPEVLARDFVMRTFAGFSLDGVLMREGTFGANPVILGVESPGIARLQNAALPRTEWLPIIQLR